MNAEVADLLRDYKDQSEVYCFPLFKRLLFVVIFLLVGVASTIAAPSDPRIGPVPGWVKPIVAGSGAALPEDQVIGGVSYQLSDMQVRVDGQGMQQFKHFSLTVLNEKGLESAANIGIRFDPSYQILTLHSVTIRRGERIIPKLNMSAIKVLQREKALENLVFDGSKTARIFLDDIRVGDMIDYAFSLKGGNPVFGGRNFGQFDMRWSVPVQRIYSRLLLQKGREVFFKYQNDKHEPVVHNLPDFNEYEWVVDNAAGLRVRGDAPRWFDPYPSVQWSEFKDWRSVARWAVPLYRPTNTAQGELSAEVERIKREIKLPEDQLVAALHYVQKNIRYLGIEVGPGSHAPSSPDVVLKRRFGDCKDKTLLTLALLHALGIEGHAALVNTQIRQGVFNQIPSPRAFNHVLVQARIGEKEYWIDPTRSPQFGSLGDISQATYGYALVVDGATQELQAMPQSPSSNYNRTILSVFDSQSGWDQPVRYTVTTLLDGTSAEEMRELMKSDNAAEMQKRYLNFFARYYPSISVAQPFNVSDNAAINQITLTEHYLIGDFWSATEKARKRQAQIVSPDLYEYFQAPVSSIRQEPLATRHPINILHTTKVLLPVDWKNSSGTLEINDPSFKFSRNETATDRQLTLVNAYRSLTDHVEAGEVSGYLANLKRARDSLGYRLTVGAGDDRAVEK